MSLWRQLTRGLRVLARRSGADRDVADEVQSYLEESSAALVESGLSSDEARRTAQMELGNTTFAREQVRSYGWENVVWTGFADLRYGARRLRKSPGFTAVGALTLALGIGASTAIMSAVNPILFEPLPYPQPDRIVMTWDIFQGARSDVTFHTWRELTARSHSFEATAVLKAWQPTMTGAAQPERLEGQSVTAGYFRALGSRTTLGRDFQESDDRFHGPHVAIVSDSLWRRRLGADATIVGQQVVLDGDLYTVIGVMPRSFENVLAPTAEIWAPLQYDSRNITNLDTQEWGHHLRMVGRLRAGLQADQARHELNAIAASKTLDFPRPPWASLRNGVMIDSLQDQITRGVRPAMLAVLGAVGLVLLIACVNVTNLLLARGAQRRGELAMRVALGASRSRLIRQMLAESALLAALGGVPGMAVAELGVQALVRLSPPGLPRVGAIALNGPVLAFALSITTLIGVAVGLIPALEASRSDPGTGAQHSSQRTTGGRQAMRRALVVSEVALALILLVSAGLLVRSLQRLFAVAPGFEASRLLTMNVRASGHRYDRDSARQQFFAQTLGAVRKVPGVAGAAFTSLLPLGGDRYGEYGTRFENGDSYPAFRYAVTPGYLEAMGIALRRGRLLDEHDGASAPPAVVISESLAAKLSGTLSGKNAVGMRVHVGPINRPWYTVVGVAADVKQNSLAEGKPDAVYLTEAQSWFVDSEMALVVRARDDATTLLPAVKNAIWSVDPDQPITHTATMKDLLAVSAAERRFAMIIFEAFALAALVLAATGIYGVLAGSVAERTREIGVRSALGASRRDILTLVLRQGMALTGLGVAIGAAGSTAATHALVALLFGVSRLDPLTYLGVIALLAAMSAIACWVPAWRAARVDPSITLRSE